MLPIIRMALSFRNALHAESRKQLRRLRHSNHALAALAAETDLACLQQCAQMIRVSKMV